MTNELLELMERISELEHVLIGEYIRLSNESFEAKDEEQYKYWLTRMRERWVESRKLDDDLWNFKRETPEWKEILDSAKRENP